MEASPEQAAEGLAIVRVLAAVLDRLVCANAPMARANPGQVTKFHAMKAPGIAIQQYLERIHKYASCSNECFILALIYIDRLIQRNNFLLTELNVHRVVITSVLLAAKFFDDAYYNNAYYAKVGGVLVSEINGLEVDFLFRINFSLHVTPDEFEKYRCELLSHSVTVSAIPTLEVHHAPAQVSPEVHSAHSAPAVMDAEPFMNCCPSELMNATTVALQITTSSPSAAQIVEAFVNAVVPDTFYPHEYVFPPVHRAHSMPVIPKASSPLYQQQQRVQPATDPMYPRCAQPIGAMPQFPTPDNPYGIIMDSRQIYPAQPTLVHHHHGSFPHRPNVVDGSVYGVAPRDVVGPQTLAPMLTSMTGGGL